MRGARLQSAHTRLSAVLSSVALVGSMVVAGAVAQVATAPDAAAAPISYIAEPLTGSSTTWVRNTPSAWGTADCLTATSAAAAAYPTVGRCTSTPPAAQPDGQGDLTLMVFNQGVSQAWHTVSFPTGRAVEASWNSYIWGANTTAGDSVNMILAAVNPTAPARPTTIGPAATDGTQGVANTWLTFLQDVSGWGPAASYNWNSPTCTWAGLPAPQATPGLTVRGPQGTKGNCPMSRTATVAGAFNQAASAVRPATPTTVLVGVNPTQAEVTLSNGVVLGAGKYWFGNSNVYAGDTVVAQGDLPTVAEMNNAGFNTAGFSGWLDPSGRYPKRLMIGFSAANNGNRQNSSINQLKVTAVDAAPLPAWDATLGSSLVAGNSASSVTMTPTLSGGPDPSTPTFTLTLPSGLTGPTWTSHAVNGYTCSSSGQTYTCTYPGSPAAPLAVGSLPELSIPVTMTTSGTGTITGSAYSSQTQNNTTTTKTLAATWAASSFTPTPVAVSNGQTITYAVSGLPSGGPGAVTITDGTTELCSFPVSTASSCTSTATPLGQRTVTATWSGNAPYAPQTWTSRVDVRRGQVLVNEPLSGGSNPLWQRVGTSTTVNYECWTAASASTTATTPALRRCPAAVNDYPDGNGSLRLVDQTASAQGAAYHTVTVPTGRGLEVGFDSYQWAWNNAGVRPGAGSTLILQAVNPANPTRPTAYGSSGGDMGYRAVPYSYLGFSLDLEGNFARSAAIWGSPTCSAPTSNGPAAGNPNSLVVRGPQGASMGNCLYSHTASAPGGTFDVPANAVTNRPLTPTRVLVGINPTNADVTLSNGVVVPAGGYWFGVKDLYNGVAPMSTSGALPTAAAMTNVGMPAAWLDSTGRYPQRLMLGLLGSNGSQAAVKEVANFAASTLDATPFPMWDLTVAPGTAGTLVAGNTSNVITVTPTLSGGPEASTATFTVTLPTGLSAPASFTSGTAPNQYTCTTSGQVVTCTYPGSPAAPIPVGTLTALAIPVTFTAAGTGTVTASVLSGQTATGTAVTKTTTATWVNQPVLVPTPAVSTKGASVTYAVNGLPASAGTVTVTVGGTTVCTFDAATTNSCASTTTPVGHQAATATWTGNSPLATQTFVNTVTVKPGTVFIGSALNAGDGTGWQRLGNDASIECLTAASAPASAATPALQKCSGAPNTWADGLGTLRLTHGGGVTGAAAYNMTSIPAARALEFTFDSHQWGGTNPPGSANTLILAIPNPTNPQRPTVYGTGGGALAYPNIPHTYLGFSVATEPANTGGIGGATCRTNTALAVRGELAVFGPQNAGKGACLFSHVAVGNANMWQTGTTRPATPNRLLAAINPTTDAVTLSNGVVLAPGKYWFGIKDLYNGAAPVSTTGDLPTVAEMANVGVTASYLDTTKQYPQRLMVGFGATGTGATAVKEVSNVAVSGFDAALPEWTLAVTDSGSGSLVAGNTGNKVLVTPTLTGAPDPSSPTVTVTLPTGLTAPASFTSGSYSCTTSAQVITCSHPGTLAAPIPVGDLPTLEVPVTTTASGSGTITASVYSAQTRTNTAVSATASTTWSTVTLTGAADLTAQGQSVTYTVTGLPASTTGSITITSGATTLCTIALPATSCAATNTPVGNATPVSASLTGSNLVNQTWSTTVQVRVGPIFSDERLTGATAGNWYRLGPDAGIECLTASSNTTATPIPGCSTTALNPVGQGAMRINHNLAQAMRGTLFHTPTFPTTQGLEVSWDNYFYNNTQSGTDESIIIRGVDPVNPTNNPSANEPFSKNQYVAAYLDVTGAVNNANWSGAGAGCPLAGNAANVRDSLVFRGPGNGTVTTGTYCWLGGTAAGPPYFFFAGSPTRPAPVRVTFAMNPTTQTLKTTSGISLPPGKMLLAFTGGYATPSTGQLMADLPSAALVNTAAGFGSGWALPNGTPKRVQIGLHGFSSAFDYSTKEFNNLVVNSLAPAGPSTWSVALSDNTSGSFVAGNTGTQKVTLTPTLAGSPDPTTPTFTVTLPAGLTPPAWSNTTVAGYTCSTAGQVVTCTYPGSQAAPIAAGGLPALDIPVTVPANATTGSKTITATANSSQTATITTVSTTRDVTVTAPAATASPASLTWGESTTLAMTGLPTGATGTITFTNAGTTLCTATLPATSCSKTTLPAGTNTVTATWSGSTPWAEQSATVSVTVTKATPTLTVSANPASALPGGEITLAVSGIPTGATGTITFKDGGGNPLCVATLPAISCTTDPALPEGTYTVAASYSGDANVNATTASNTVTFTIGKAAVSITGAATPATVEYRSPSTLSVSGLTAGTTGTVAFTTAGGTTLCTVTVGTSTTCTTPVDLAVGAYQVTATYSGDASHLAATSAPFTLTVSERATTIGVSLSPTSVAFGSTATLTVTGLPVGATGTVTFTHGTAPGMTLCTVTLPAISCSTPASLTVGTYAVSARYSGDGNNAASVGGPQTLTVTKVSVAVTGSASPAATPFGTASTLSASGLPAAASGTLTFTADGTTLCTATLPATTCDTDTALAAGTYSVTVDYSGDSDHAAATSAAFSLTITPADASLTVAVAPTSITYGDTATVTVGGLPAGATGTLTVTDAATGATLCTATLPATTCDLPVLTAGTHEVLAAWGGDANHNATTSATAATLTVAKASTAVTASIAPTTITAGDSATVTAGGLPADATGSWSVTDGEGTVICGGTLPTTTCSTASTLTAGAHSLTVTYNGDLNHAASTAAAGTLTVAKVSTSIALTLDPQFVTFGTPSVITVTGLPDDATGTLTISDGGTVLCTLTLPTHTCTTPADLTVGTHDLSAIYGGDATHEGDLSGTETLTVTKVPTNLTVEATPSSIPYGTFTTLTLTAGGIAPTATGTLTFTNAGTPVCTTTLPVVSCETSPLVPVGSYEVIATYAGDTTHDGDISDPATFTVTPAATQFTLVATPAIHPYGQVTTFAQTGLPAGSTGTVTLTDGATTLCTIVLPGETCDGPAGLSVGEHAVQAAYSGDGNHAASTATATVTVTKAPSTVSALLESASTPFGTGVTVSAQGLPAGATGTITVTDRATGQVLCTATLPAGCDTPTDLPVGDHELVLTYSGDDTYEPSTAPVQILTVTKAATSPGATVSPATISHGQTSTITVTGLPASATGTVTATDAATGAVLCTITLPATTCTTAASLPAGGYQVQVSYPGDGTYAGATSATTPLTVSRATVTPVATVTPTSYPYGGTATFAVTGLPPAASGTVTFRDETGTTLCTATLPTTSCTGGSTLTGGTHQVTATYSGDANTTSATSAAKAFTVTAATISPAPTLTLAAATIPYGDTATVSINGIPDGASGSVTVTDEQGTLLCVITLPDTSCTSAAITLTPGAHTLTADYTGDDNWAPATATAPLTVTKAASAVTVAVAPASTAFGTAATVTVGALPSGATGTVTITDTSTGDVACTIPLPGTTCDTPIDLAVGDHPLTATWSGDATHTGSTSTPVTLTVTKAATTPAITVSPTSTTYGEPATVTVTGLPAGATGTVTVTDTTTGAVVCTITLLDTTCATPANLPAGAHTLVVDYSGDGSYAASTGTTSVTLTVAKATPSITVGAANSSLTFGTTTTFTATGVPAGATDTLTWASADGTEICTATLPATSCTGGAALPVGDHQVTVTYSGDANHTAATSAPTTVTVTTASPTLTVTLSPASVVPGGTTTATISGLPAGATGQVAITAPDGTVLCTITLPATSCTTGALDLPVGPHTLTADYPGDANVAPATGTASLTVGGKPVAVTVTTEGTTTYRAGATLTATGLPSDATGTLTFTDAATGQVLCTATLPATGCEIPLTLPAGTYQIRVTYSGDSTYAGDASGLATLVIERADPSAVSGTPFAGDDTGSGRYPYGTVITLRHVGLPADATGTVIFYGSILCTATLPASSCTTADDLPVGVENGTASYSGDRNYLPKNDPFTFEIYALPTPTQSTGTATPAPSPTKTGGGGGLAWTGSAPLGLLAGLGLAFVIFGAWVRRRSARDSRH